MFCDEADRGELSSVCTFVLEMLEESSARVAPVSDVAITIDGRLGGTDVEFKLRTVAPLFLAFSIPLVVDGPAR